MQSILPRSVLTLIEEFGRLPGIGPKTASRLAFYLLTKNPDDIGRLGKAVIEIGHSLVKCKNCFNISEEEYCPLCRDTTRDRETILVVAEPLDIVALERTGYKGTYHVLGGVISPIDGIGPDDLTIRQLLDKLKSKSVTVKELIIATNPSLEGEATALYLDKIISRAKDDGLNKPIAVTRIARGLPMGGDVEYADELTLRKALEGRKKY